MNPKKLYNMVTNSQVVYDHINLVWNVKIDHKVLSKTFKIIWSKYIEPKKSYFRWLLILKKLAVGFDNNLCSICNVVESCEHVFLLYLC